MKKRELKVFIKCLLFVSFFLLVMTLFSFGVSAALNCRVGDMNGFVNEDAYFYGRGGTGSYSWNSLNGGTFQGAIIGSPVKIRYADTGTKTMEVTSGAESATCKVYIAENTPSETKLIFDYNSASNGASGINGEYSWTVPAGVTKINVEMWGGGGGGGYSYKTYNNHQGGGGGGGGGYSKAEVSVEANSILRIYVGKGGEAGVDVNDRGGECAVSGGDALTCHYRGYSTSKGGGASAIAGDLIYIGSGGGGSGGNGCDDWDSCVYTGYAGQPGQGYYGYYGVQSNPPNGEGSGKGGYGGDVQRTCRMGSGGAGGSGFSYSNNPLNINQAGTGGQIGTMSGVCADTGTSGSGKGGDAYIGGIGGITKSAGSAPGGGGGGGTEESIGGNGGNGRVVITYLAGQNVVPPVVQTACANDNQIMFRLLSESNSHAANYAEQSYPVKICYDQIFGKTFDGANPRQCTSGNKVIRLSSATNAHAEGPAGTTSGYQDVCFGDLACTLKDNSCAADEKAVASLSSVSNTHITIGSDSAYTKKICCKISSGMAGSTSIKHRGIYFTNTDILFDYTPIQQGASISWMIESSNQNEQDISVNEKRFTRKFAAPGQRTITIKETAGNKLPIETQIAILVVDGLNNGMFVFIEKPKHEQKVLSNELKVDYAGEESYLIQLAGSSCTRTISCISGNCPILSENAPAGCTNKISVTGTPKNFGNLKFKWSFPFSDKIESIEGEGDAFSKGTEKYPSPGNYRIDLLLKYPSGNIEQLFQRKFSLWSGSCKDGVCAICQDNGASLAIIDNEGKVIQTYPTADSIMGEKPACAGADGLVSTSDDCCPSGQTCRLAQGSIKAGCIPNPEIDECKDYQNVNDCNNDINNVGNGMKIQTILDPLRGQISCGNVYSANSCMYRITCRCQWDAAPGAGNQPYCAIQRSDEKTNDKCTSGPGDLGKCNYKSSDQSSCENGFKTIKIEATYINGATAPPWCQNKEVTIPCGRSVLELSFFGLWQAAAALLVIIAAYLIIEKMKKKKRK